MNFWITVWTITLILGVGVFAVLAVVVTIGGAFDIFSLLRMLKAQHQSGQKDDTSDNSEPSAAED